MAKRLWTQEENDILIYLKEVKKIQKWTSISEIMENQYGITGRNGKQCRQRYHNHLNSSISKAEWSKDELENLIQLHRKYGNSWALIARELPGRTDNCAKNHFYSILRKGLKKFNNLLKMKLKRCKPFRAQIIFLLASKQSNILESQIQSKTVISFLLDIAYDEKDAQNLSKQELLKFHKKITASLKNTKDSDQISKDEKVVEEKKQLFLESEKTQQALMNDFNLNLEDLIQEEWLNIDVPPFVEMKQYLDDEQMGSDLSAGQDFRRNSWLQDHLYI